MAVATLVHNILEKPARATIRKVVEVPAHADLERETSPPTTGVNLTDPVAEGPGSKLGMGSGADALVGPSPTVTITHAKEM